MEADELRRMLSVLNVKLGLGQISPEGFQAARHDITKRLAEIEITLMDATSSER